MLPVVLVYVIKGGWFLLMLLVDVDVLIAVVVVVFV